MTNQDTWRDLLLKEKGELETELAKVGRANPEQAGDWEVKPLPAHDTAFRDEVADELEEMDEREEVEVNLEQRLKEVNAALVRIENGTYGVCEVAGEPIETDRLQANPAARTCKAHRNAR